jgi:hypothetical protein
LAAEELELDVCKDFSLILAKRGGPEKVDKDLRASLIAAIAAVALSALIGVIAGVGAAALLLRALACGLLMGAAVYGGIFLLRKTMPELLEPAPEARPDASPLAEPATAETDLGAESLTGANVNIVLPGDEGGEVEMLEPGAEAFAKAKPAFEEEEYVEDAEEAEDAEDASLIEAEDSSGEAAMPPNARAAVSGGAAAGAFHGTGAEASPRAAARPADPAEDRGSRQPGGFDELDVLPDLDGFTDSFTASEFSSGGSGGDRSERMPPVPSGGGSRPSRSGQEGADPAALAQAVRTILKRDQKG